MKKICCLLVLFFSLTLSVAAQSDDTERTWSVNEGTLIGVGGYNLQDTYLSPGKGVNYTGWGLSILNERMKMVRLADYNVSRQQIFKVEFTKTDNAALTASDIAGLAEYTLGYHYHFEPFADLKLLAGASARGLAGFIYNTRNGNNPASAKVDIDLNASVMALYNFRIKDYPITLRYQFQIPFAGVLFSPHYGQSYYEIFSLGNYDGVIKFNSFHNKFAMKNYLTFDFPVGIFTVRAGYMNSYYYTDVNNIQSHIISNSFVIGLVKEFVSFGGKRMKNNNKIRSAYY